MAMGWVGDGELCSQSLTRQIRRGKWQSLRETEAMRAGTSGCAKVCGAGSSVKARPVAS